MSGEHSGGYLDIRTSDREYTVCGTLRSFERRFPICWQRVNILLVAGTTGPF